MDDWKDYLAFFRIAGLMIAAIVGAFVLIGHLVVGAIGLAGAGYGALKGALSPEAKEARAAERASRGPRCADELKSSDGTGLILMAVGAAGAVALSALCAQSDTVIAEIQAQYPLGGTDPKAYFIVMESLSLFALLSAVTSVLWVANTPLKGRISIPWAILAGALAKPIYSVLDHVVSSTESPQMLANPDFVPLSIALMLGLVAVTLVPMVVCLAYHRHVAKEESVNATSTHYV